MKTVQNIIIGFGKGGKTLAKFLAKQGEEVLVVEKSREMYGGTCINIACLPSKRLITEAARGTPGQAGNGCPAAGQELPHARR